METVVSAQANERSILAFLRPSKIGLLPPLRRANARKQLTFGDGIHFCLGTSLARVEMKIVLEEFFKCFPKMRLVQPDTVSHLHTSCSARLTRFELSCAGLVLREGSARSPRRDSEKSPDRLAQTRRMNIHRIGTVGAEQA